MAEALSHDLMEVAESLLKSADAHAPIESVKALSAGGNNRTYCIGNAHGQFVLKHYFQHAGDSRDRLQAEYAFTCFANDIGVAVTPKPLAIEVASGIALYEYIEGELFQQGDIGVAEVEAAAAFVEAMNHPDAKIAAQKLSVASEAAFSLREHLDNTDRRLNQLADISSLDDLGQEAKAFIHALHDYWQKYMRGVSQRENNLQELGPDERCISPSDFGFHNALRAGRGEIYFIDFEYAGWDDPAKMVIDFFLQPAVPVPMQFYGDFELRILSLFGDPVLLKDRIRLLWPAYQVKWCCIALNVFLPSHLERRMFANPELNPVELRRERLTQAQSRFQEMKDQIHGLH